jgi:positive regulator of sigma E activity
MASHKEMEGDHNKDFLLQRRPVSRVQIVGLLLYIFAMLIFVIGLWSLLLSQRLVWSEPLVIVTVALGAGISSLFLRLAWLGIRRIFAGRAAQRHRRQANSG